MPKTSVAVTCSDRFQRKASERLFSDDLPPRPPAPPEPSAPAEGVGLARPGVCRDAQGCGFVDVGEQGARGGGVERDSPGP